MGDRWPSAQEVEEYRGVGKDAVDSCVATMGTPGHWVGRFSKFERDEVDAWVRAGGADGGASEVEMRRGRP